MVFGGSWRFLGGLCFFCWLLVVIGNSRWFLFAFGGSCLFVFLFLAIFGNLWHLLKSLKDSENEFKFLEMD